MHFWKEVLFLMRFDLVSHLVYMYLICVYGLYKNTYRKDECIHKRDNHPCHIYSLPCSHCYTSVRHTWVTSSELAQCTVEVLRQFLLDTDTYLAEAQQLFRLVERKAFLLKFKVSLTAVTISIKMPIFTWSIVMVMEISEKK